MIVGNEGFAISENLVDFVRLIEKGMINDVYGESFQDAGQAYVAACRLCVERAYNQRRLYSPLPKLDELIRYGGLYLDPTYQKPKAVITVRRYFSVVSERGFVTSANFVDIAEFVRLYCQWHCEIIESPDKEALLQTIQKKYAFQRMAMSAYIVEPLLMPQKINIGEAFMDYSLQKSAGLDNYQQLFLGCYSRLVK
jgi:hypothetical protein